MASKQQFKAFVQEAKNEAQNFDVNAWLRGAQLTVVGAFRALQNPRLFKSEVYRQAAIAVSAGIAIRLLIEGPIFFVRIILWIVGHFVDLQHAQWHRSLLEGLNFVANVVLQIPYFLMSLRQVISIGPSLDETFMASLEWVDHTYYEKHKSDDQPALRAGYYKNLSQYPRIGGRDKSKGTMAAVSAFAYRFGRRAAISLAVYLLSFVPVVGRFVLPAASFYTFNQAVGPVPSGFIFALGLLLPRRYLVVFLQSYFASRSLVREMLQPYFARIKFTKEQKRKFFRDREGVLFGFGLGFFLFLQIPLLGVLIYGVAEASTAYLVTKITDPPPPPAENARFAESQVRWTNKHAFLRLPLGELDATNVSTTERGKDPLRSGEMAGKKYS